MPFVEAKRESIKKILRIDRENELKVVSLLKKGFGANFINLSDELAQLISNISKKFGKSGVYDKHSVAYNNSLEKLSWGSDTSVRELAKMLNTAYFIGKPSGPDHAAEAVLSRKKATSFLVRIWLLMRLKRDFQWGLSELLRLKISSGIGYLRVQSETIAIMVLSVNTDFAAEYIKTSSLEAGQVFYRKYHKSKIDPMLKELGLYEYFDYGSGISQHSRIAGIAGGISAGSKISPSGSTALIYQEASHPIHILVRYMYYIRANTRILECIRRGIDPKEMKWNGLGKKIQHFSSMVEADWGKVLKLYEKNRQEIFKTEFMPF